DNSPAGVIQDVLLDQAAHVIGGTLIVVGGAVQGGSTVTLSPMWLASSVNSVNIVGGLTATMQGFSAISPLTANNAGLLNIQNGGNINFQGSGVFNITGSSTQVLEVFGHISADAGLTININGQAEVVNGGTLTGGTSVSLQST